jgi:hypothetical protein
MHHYFTRLSLFLCTLALLCGVASAQEEFVGPFSSWHNVKTACGAAGNGTTDDTSALQNCINGLNGSYDVVYLPAGTYKISSTLQVTYKQYFMIVGADPSTVTIKWAGSGGGTMMHVNGGLGTHEGRITWDGNSSAGIGVAHKWDFSGGTSSTNIEHFDEVYKNMSKGIVAGAPPGDNDDTITIRRTTFTGITDTGISSETQNALNLMCWDCTFTNNARGMANDRAAILGGNLFAYRCLFQNSSVADVEFANPSSFISVRWSTSSGSNRFIWGQNEGQNGGALTAQGNTVLDTTNAAAIEIGNIGLGIILDNKIRSAVANSSAAVVMDPGNGASGSDLISVGNQYTVSPGASVTAGSPVRFWSQEDSTVSRSAISSSLPAMPPTPGNMSRQVFDLTAGSSASTIQTAINNANAVHAKAVVHLQPGDYNIASTLSFPSGSDVQFVGDGYYSSLHWTGASGGKLLQLNSGSKVTVEDIELDGNGHSADDIEVNTEDTSGSRVWIDNSYQDHASTDSIFADSLAHTAINVTAPWLANDSGSNVKSTGTGSVGSSYLAIFGGTTAYNGGGADPMYEVASGGQLLVEDAWWEGSATLINPTSSGNFTYNGGHISPQAGTAHALVSMNGFSGNFTLLGLDTDFHHNSAWNYTFGTGTASTNVLVAGVQCCLFDQNVSGGASSWLIRSGSGGTVSFLNNKNSGNDGDWQLGDSGTGRTSGAIDNSLALLRNTRPVADPPPATSAGITDVQIYRTHVFNPRIGLHIKSASGIPTISSFTASPSSVSSGGAVTLAWSVQNATSLGINQNVGPVTGGSVVVHPTATTTYLLTATNGSGSSAASATVTVTPAGNPPVISSFTATPSSITSGGSSTLAWSITGSPTSVSIDNGLGAQIGSSVSVSPAVTTTYKITATNSFGTTTATVTVTVTPPAGSNLYIASSATGVGDGSSCANAYALSFFNTSGNWGSSAGQIGPGITVHLCGVIVGLANSTALTFQGSGSSGNVLTLKFESGASLSAPYWSANGAINLGAHSYLVVDGGTNGVIQNTANGTGLANQQTSVGVYGSGATHAEVKNLTIKNIYVNQGSSSSASDSAGVNTVGIQFNGNSTSSLADHNTVSQAKTGIQFAMDSGGDASSIQIFSNKISDVDWGINVGGGDPGDTATGVQIYANDISNWTNWQFPTSAYHQDGIILFNVGNSSAGIIANVYNNYIHGDLGVGSPTGFIYCADFSSCTVYNNLLVNSGHTIDGIIWLGQTSNNGKTMGVYNNTIVSTQNDIGLTLALSGHATVKNNIFNGVSVGIHDYNTLTSTVTASNNNLWQTTSGAAPQMATGDSTFVNYSAWQTDGFDLNSSTVAPNLNTSYAPNTGSPAIGLGANLTSLSITSLDFDYAGTSRPATGNWTAGAFQVGGGGGGGGGPTISSFTATANPINQNSSTTICWSVTGATTISIDPGIGPVTGTCVSVSPSATTTYTLKATNSSGSSQQQLILTVNTGTVPTISSFSASPNSITAGASVTLSWTITGATSVSIDNSLGTQSGTSVSVSPTVTTTYILTATNTFGTNRAAVIVTVTAAAVPTISSFTCTPSSISRGARSTCAWSVTGADSLFIDKGVGPVTGTSIVLAPIITTTYTLTATNTAGPATLTATITVNNTATQGFFATQIKAADRQGTAAGTKIFMTDGTFTTGHVPIYLGDGTAHDSGSALPIVPAWIKETPAGTLNGTNTSFTLSFTPIVGSLTLFYGASVQLEGADFTLSGATITFASAPASSARFQARYQH